MSSYVYMVETAKTPCGVWTGDSIHLIESDAISARPADGRVTPFLVSNPAKTVREVSARLAARTEPKFDSPCSYVA